MLATASGQVGFFDAAELVRPLPSGSLFALLAEHGQRIVRDEDFAACYSAGMGRPSIPPSQLAKVLLLQYRTGVSDEQAMECVAWDLRWKIALGLAVDHAGWHPAVNGHRFLPSYGHQNSPLADTFSPHGRPSVLPSALSSRSR